LREVASFVGSLQLRLGPCPNCADPAFSKLANNPMTPYLFPEQSPRAQNIGEVRNERSLEIAVSAGSSPVWELLYSARVLFSRHD
jgi:hypothetical protein